ncbi:hypothetical protein FOA52_004220 [Chlamydomonas sp. UWO 241]|nr:hypothetical protein FOA52_004220 [Chlamydomonas sp. UWO 241]
MVTHSLYGFACRILLLSATSFSTYNRVTLEFSTPPSQNVDSLLFCVNDTNFVLNTVYLDSLMSGGDLYSPDPNGTNIFSGRAAVRNNQPAFNAPAFFRTSLPLLPVEAPIGVEDVLGTEAYYASSFSNLRYDDFQEDAWGRNIRGVVKFPTLPPPNITSRPLPNLYANSSVNGSSVRPGNCMLVTGQWAINTRYEMSFLTWNPPAPPGSNSSNPPRPPFPALWMMPLSATNVWGTIRNPATGSPESDVVFSVRGSMYGNACPVREPAVPSIGTMFDACAEAAALGLPFVLPNTSDTADAAVCLSALRSYSQPPSPPPAPPSPPSPPAPPPAPPRPPPPSPRCVKCVPTGTAINAVNCSCPAGAVSFKAGDVACGPAVGLVNNTTVGALPALCSDYVSMLAMWHNGTLSDRTISRSLLTAFATQAAGLISASDVVTANATFYATSGYIFDARLSWSPTRQPGGIAPNCNKCEDGLFNNSYNGSTPTLVYDFHFDAMQVFRVIGFVFATQLGYPCPELWDPEVPNIWTYGAFQSMMCQVLPTEFKFESLLPGAFPPPPSTSPAHPPPR